MPLAPLFALVAFFQANPFPQAVLPTPPNADQVVARVNGEEIRAKDIEPLLWDWRGYEVTQDVITYRLIQTEAKRAGVTVADADIESRYQEQIKTVKASLQGRDLDTSLREQGFPKSRIYLRIQTDLLLDKIVLSRFKAEDYARVSTIAFNPKSESATDLEAAIKRANEAYDRLNKGGDWRKEVASSDNDPQLKDQAGMLGWRRISVFPAPTQTELNTLKLGGVTKPARVGSMLQIFRVEAKGAGADAKDIEELKKTYVPQARQELVSKLRSEAKIERLLGKG